MTAIMLLQIYTMKDIYAVQLGYRRKTYLAFSLPELPLGFLAHTSKKLESPYDLV